MGCDNTTPIASGFLKHYANPDYAAIPANAKHKLYPMGGVMPISFWGFTRGYGQITNQNTGISEIDADPGHGNVNRNAANTVLRINKYDVEKQADRGVVLSSLAINDELHFYRFGLAAFLEFKVVGPITDHGTWASYGVSVLETGSQPIPSPGWMRTFIVRGNDTTGFSKYQKKVDIERLVASGFTAHGVDFSGSADPNTNIGAWYAHSLGMRSIAHVYAGSYAGNYGNACSHNLYDGDYGPDGKEGYMLRRTSQEQLQYIQDPRWNNFVDMWFVVPEETAQRMDRDQYSSCGRDAAGRFLKNVRLKINENDPLKRPMVNTELIGTAKDQYIFVNRYRESYSPQSYQVSVFHAGKSELTGYYPAAQVQSEAKRISEAIRDQTFDDAVPTLEKQFSFPLIGMFHNMGKHENPLPPSIANWEMYTGYMAFTFFTENAKGMSFYGWHLLCNDWIGDRCQEEASNADFEIARSGILSFVERFTRYNFQNACLWGKNMKGLSDKVNVTYTGPPAASYKTSCARKVDGRCVEWRWSGTAALIWLDKQLGNCRYIAFVNSHWTDTCNVTLGNLPIGKFITNIITGVTAEILSTTQTFALTRENWAAFVISDGSTTPVLPRVDPVDPATVVRMRNERQTFTAEAHNETSAKWQFRDKGEILESDWKDI